jgi:hypothetical protein
MHLGIKTDAAEEFGILKRTVQLARQQRRKVDGLLRAIGKFDM